MSTRLPDDLPSPAQPDLFERPLIHASARGVAEVSTPVQADGWRSPPAVPPTYRHGHTAGYPHPYAATRPHRGPSAAAQVYASRLSTYPKAYT